jgi:acyl-CoA reductase-like NAD-dependent aldehyde dehydrogenase
VVNVVFWRLFQFTNEERALLRDLHDGLDAKFDEIARLLAIQLGYNPADPRGREEAQDAIDRWEENAEMERKPIEPTSPLQRLLREHHENL